MYPEAHNVIQNMKEKKLEKDNILNRPSNKSANRPNGARAKESGWVLAAVFSPVFRSNPEEAA
jgi:hypothetical protein